MNKHLKNRAAAGFTRDSLDSSLIDYPRRFLQILAEQKMQSTDRKTHIHQPILTDKFEKKKHSLTHSR